jgi:hypothetical protein
MSRYKKALLLYYYKKREICLNELVSFKNFISPIIYNITFIILLLFSYVSLVCGISCELLQLEDCFIRHKNSSAESSVNTIGIYVTTNKPFAKFYTTICLGFFIYILFMNYIKNEYMSATILIPILIFAYIVLYFMWYMISNTVNDVLFAIWCVFIGIINYFVFVNLKKKTTNDFLNELNALLEIVMYIIKLIIKSISILFIVLESFSEILLDESKINPNLSYIFVYMNRHKLMIKFDITVCLIICVYVLLTNNNIAIKNLILIAIYTYMILYFVCYMESNTLNNIILRVWNILIGIINCLIVIILKKYNDLMNKEIEELQEVVAL